MDYTIRDSSLYSDYDSTSLLYEKDTSVRVGTIRSEVYLKDFQETRYTVEVWDNGVIVPVSCIRTSRFGGLYNYEEYTHRGFIAGDSAASTIRELQPGDQVVVAFLNGDSREGIIIGSVPHLGRREVINHKDAEPNDSVEFVNRDGPTTVRYASEFNGVESLINASGEYRVTFKGQPTNLDKLSEAPDGEEYPLPEYDIDVGFSYYEFDKSGSYLLTDNANDELPQSIRVDKPNGKMEIVSGKTSLIIDKNKESYTVSNKITSIESADKFNLATKNTTIDSTEAFNLTAKDIKTKGEWEQSGNMTLQGNTEQIGNVDITGNLSTTGETLLAGGANPLIYDIILIQGAGNLGAPVISTATVLKTSLTKAS